MPINFITFEAHNVSIQKDTRWIDIGAQIHVTTTMQGFLTTRSPRPNEVKVLSGSGKGDLVEAVETF